MDRSYTTTFVVEQTPEDVFAAINNVRGWWSQAIEGRTDELGAEFNYHYQDVHRCAFSITEFVPGKKVVWHVVDNYFNFIKDKTEWIGTDIVFEIGRAGDQTEVRFTHVGLVPAYECYDICSDAWGRYINGSLRSLIATGEGQPNPLEDIVSKARQMSDQAYTTSFIVDQSPEDVFAAVTNVRGWWSENIDGSTDQPGAEFTFWHQDVHRSRQQITELAPGKRVVWHVVDSYLKFASDTAEWTGTDVVFEITRQTDKTELRFTHAGLVPALECYAGCSDAWGFYINTSLRSLITTGQGQPETQASTEDKAAAR
jgi:hypothetical protein